MKVAVIAIVLSAVFSSVYCHPEFVYAGFNHLLVFDTKNVSVTAYDYRRSLPANSLCDAFTFPPLVGGARMQDWLTNDALSVNAQTELTYTHLGYEVFIVENKKTGSYITRRCRDFRPQLTVLPCEALGTGSSPYLKDPYRTIFIGNDRVMILNTETAQYFVQLFDADVHTGADPFRFSMGPVLTGTFPFNDGLATADFAYVQLKNHGGDVMLVKRGDGTVEGYRFNSNARDEKDWYFLYTFTRTAPAGMTMKMLGENQAILYDNQYNFAIWDVSQNNVNEVSVSEFSHGNAYVGHPCITDNVTECTMMDGCAWCPISYTCHAYDHRSSYFCDNVCSVPAIAGPIMPGAQVIVPDCVKEVPVEATHAEIFDTVDEGYALLPGNMRLPRSYRADLGDFPNSDVAPINPLLDNELGEQPEPDDWNHPADIVDVMNRVAENKVYRPPVITESQPCMNGEYDPKKAVEIPAASLANKKMNTPPSEKPVPVFALSPSGDAPTATESTACERNATRRSSEEKFIPRAGEVLPPSTEYIPASTATMHEEDLMNFDKTPHADIKGQMGVEAARDTDAVRAPERLAEIAQFKPKEGGIRSLTPKTTEVVAPPLRLYKPTEADAMNAGLGGDQLLANPDCTETGGIDGRATSTMSSAMQNSARPVMPETLEAQLNLFKNEEKHVIDNNMFPGSAPTEEQLKTQLPPAKQQPVERTTETLNTAINAVSPDKSQSVINRISRV